MGKQRLELTWIGKNVKPKLEPRILIEDPEKSFGSQNSENMLIHGDNLLALKALEQEYSGKIKCIYIDPPYNTGNAFEHYDDGLEHSIWLGLMRDRLVFLRKLLAEDGFICVHIDDSEGQYLKILLDEVFGRDNYQITLYVQVRYTGKTLKQDMRYHKQIEQIHVYRKSYGAFPNLPIKALSFDKFNYYIEELEKGQEINLGGKNVEVFTADQYKIHKREGSEDGLKEIWATGSILDGNSSGRFFRDYLTGRYNNDGLGVLYKVEGIGDDKFDHRYFTGPKREGATKGKYFQGVPIAKLDISHSHDTYPIQNFYDMAADFGNCRHEGGVDFRSGKKPEKLLEFIFRTFSNEGDLVLDSFGGSGTTAAVAHKLKRKWIMVELGDHCYSHCKVRLDNVISGRDKTGVTQIANWTGGGGYRFYELAPSLLNKDDHGNWIINKQYNANMLAFAMAKQEGFKYNPDSDHYWKQGQSTEQDFIFTTTEFLTQEHLEHIHSLLKEGESLLICCKAFNANDALYPNITIKKIPLVLMGKCEFGKDDYSLNIINLPTEEIDDELETEAVSESKPKYIAGQAELFDMEDDNE